MLNLFLQADAGRDLLPLSPRSLLPPPPAVSREEELTSNPEVAAQRQQGFGYPQTAHDQLCSACPVSWGSLLTDLSGAIAKAVGLTAKGPSWSQQA